jgi:hypothetical protein
LSRLATEVAKPCGVVSTRKEWAVTPVRLPLAAVPASVSTRPCQIRPDTNLIMSKMLAAGVEANTISYNTVIKACAEAKGVVTAGQWMSKMLFAGLGGRTVDVQDAGCKDLLSADTCYIYIPVLSRSSQGY